MGSNVKRYKTASKVGKRAGLIEKTYGGYTLATLIELTSTQVAEEGEDQDVFTRRELEKLWKKSADEVLAMLRQLSDLGKVEPVMAKRRTLHGQQGIKAYRIKA